ncbi:MAG: hypothetical protein J2P36_06200 [Ktedonobacteraceae bacterium]|nr:hypothetical protein [Ktedonobacteraceae bacterium]
MPPLHGVGKLSAPRATGSALMSISVPRSLSGFESTNPMQGSGLAASLAPRSSLHERKGRTVTLASSSQDA